MNRANSALFSCSLSSTYILCVIYSIEIVKRPIVSFRLLTGEHDGISVTLGYRQTFPKASLATRQLAL